MDSAPGVLLLASAWLGGCGSGAEASAAALSDLERLSFVPSGQATLGALLPIVLYECPQPLLVDRYEVTREEWKRFLALEPQALGRQHQDFARSWQPESDAWPASYMTQGEAEAFARWRGMRLPSSSEWLFCALGPERRPFPWPGYEDQDSVANTLDLGLGRPCAVGTFEGGRTSAELYDMLGNVAEWTLDDVFLREQAARAEPAQSADRGRRVSALGGSFRSWSRRLFHPRRSGELNEQDYLALSLHPESRLDDVGLRCVAPASEYLWNRAARLGRDQESRARLTALGRRWGRAAVGMLAELAARPGAPAALEALLSGASR